MLCHGLLWDRRLLSYDSLSVSPFLSLLFLPPSKLGIHDWIFDILILGVLGVLAVNSFGMGMRLESR